MQINWQGVFPAATTQFHADQSLDLANTLQHNVDDLILESIVVGAVGWVSGLVNAFPNENHLLWELARRGDYAEALKVYRWYMPLLHLDTHTKLVQYIKLAQAECGLGSEMVRAPRLPLVGEERDRILRVIHQAIATRPSISTT